MPNIEDNLTKKLFRALCPDSMELDDYQTGALPQARMDYIRDHLQECHYCRQEMEQTRAFLQATRPDLEWSLPERIRVLVARLVKASGGAGWTPALQGVRGHAEHVLTYETEGMQVILDVQADPERSDLRAIYGLLVGAEEGQQFEARLAGGSQPASPTALDEFGNFSFLSIAPGQYGLTLAGPAVTVQIEDLVIE
jgi:hypothetical protein